MFIRSERLFLRPGWPEDWQELRSRIADGAVVRNLEFTPQAAQSYVGQGQNRRFPHFLVTLPGREGAHLLGAVGLLCGGYGAELVYWIAPEHWGRGYATEAARALLSLARTLGHRAVASLHFVDNPAAARVLAKLGFRDTGEVCQRLCPARSSVAPALVHRRTLGSSSDCDGANRIGAQHAA